MESNEFETEAPTTEYTPEEWSEGECSWMLLIAARMDAARSATQEAA